MQRLRPFFVLVAFAGVGCVSVRGVERGPLVDRTSIAAEHTDRHVAIVDDARASLRTERRTCTTYKLRYTELEVQNVTHPGYGFLIPGTLLTTAGVALLSHVLGDDTAFTGGGKATSGEAALIFAVPSLLVGSLLLMTSFMPDSLLQTTRKVPRASFQSEEDLRCENSTFAAQEAAAWDLSIADTRRTGRTGANGMLVLEPVLVGILQDAPLSATAQRLAVGGSVTIRLKLGDAPIVSRYLPASRVPNAGWEAMFSKHEGALAPTRQLRWNACTGLASSKRAAIECLWRDDAMPGKLVAMDGTLARTDEGEYGAVHEFQAARGERFTYRLLLPGENIDWLVQVVELATGHVVAESFSGESVRHDISGVLPRTGDYAVVLNAVRPGRYASVLTLGTK